MEQECPACDGSGLDRFCDNMSDCTHCDGTGVVYGDPYEDDDEEY